MGRRTLKWTGILGPGLIAGLFETLRHDYFDAWLSATYGNLATSFLVVVASGLLLGQVFRLMERSEHALRVAETRNSVLHERDRIARDLHDGVSQSIFYLNVKVQEIEKSLRSRHGSLGHEDDFNEVRGVLGGLYDTVRQTIFELKGTQGLGEAEFTVAIRKYLSDFEDQFGMETHVHCLEHICSPECPELEIELFRILQEGLFNAWRHSGVDSVGIWLTSSPEYIHLKVQDSGRGFEPHRAPGPKGGHFGLSLIRERAERLGGKLEIQSRPREGTTVRFWRSKEGAEHR